MGCCVRPPRRCNRERVHHALVVRDSKASGTHAACEARRLRLRTYSYGALLDKHDAHKLNAGFPNMHLWRNMLPRRSTYPVLTASYGAVLPSVRVIVFARGVPQLATLLTIMNMTDRSIAGLVRQENRDFQDVAFVPVERRDIRDVVGGGGECHGDRVTQLQHKLRPCPFKTSFLQPRGV